jgi:serine O-acetyltransferase
LDSAPFNPDDLTQTGDKLAAMYTSETLSRPRNFKNGVFMDDQQIAGMFYNQGVDSPGVLKGPGLRAILAIIRSDLARYGSGSGKSNLFSKFISCIYSHPASLGVVYYRLGQWLWPKRRQVPGVLFWYLYRFCYPMVRMYSGVELSPQVQIGSGLSIFHFGPTVIHPLSIAGRNLTMLHGVTIGEAKSGVPRIGDNVLIGAHATLIGGIVVGDNVQIGAGAVVTTDLPDNCVAVGIPAKPVASRLPSLENSEL